MLIKFGVTMVGIFGGIVSTLMVGINAVEIFPTASVAVMVKRLSPSLRSAVIGIEYFPLLFAVVV